MRASFFFLVTVTAFVQAIAGAAEPPPSADDIMARVAMNQDRAERARASFVYRQNIVVRLRDSGNKLVREEISDYQVMPDAQATRKELAKFSGRYARKGSMVSYNESGQGHEDGFRNEADADLAHSMGQNLVGDKKSKDGVGHDLFPLTARELPKYRFTLKGEEKYQGTAVYRIGFEPNEYVNNDRPWKGEALVSKADFAPLLVSTKLAHNLPLLVRTALGTNLPGLGFTVQYRKFDDGVWFPVSYGTEFRIRALFVYSRHVSISMVNSDFRHADVKSTVAFDSVP
jgi:hypothetical protein